MSRTTAAWSARALCPRMRIDCAATRSSTPRARAKGPLGVGRRERRAGAEHHHLRGEQVQVARELVVRVPAAGVEQADGRRGAGERRLEGRLLPRTAGGAQPERGELQPVVAGEPRGGRAAHLVDRGEDPLAVAVADLPQQLTAEREVRRLAPLGGERRVHRVVHAVVGEAQRRAGAGRLGGVHGHLPGGGVAHEQARAERAAETASANSARVASQTARTSAGSNDPPTQAATSSARRATSGSRARRGVSSAATPSGTGAAAMRGRSQVSRWRAPSGEGAIK